MNRKIVEHQYYSITELIANTHIAPFQRLEDKEHIDTIYQGIESYYRQFNEIFLPNTISVAKLNENSKFIVLDGQHRLKALVCLSETFPETGTIQIRTDVYTVSSLDEARDIYTIINSSKKVELYTGNLEPYIIPKIQKYFIDRFEKYCKKSVNPIRLNINIDTLAKKIQGYDLIVKTGVEIDTTDKLIDTIKQLNQYYSEQTIDTLVSYGLKTSLIQDLKNNRENCFYLGLYKRYEWIQRIIDYYRGIEFEDQDHSISEQNVKIQRKKIPKRLRDKVWNKRVDNKLRGQCFCCMKDISYNDFDCGHIVSVKELGKDELDNLEAVCRICNLDMGTMNMNKYKSLFD